LDPSSPLERYGIDSLLVVGLTNELEKSFGSLSKTLLFETQTIQALTEFFLQEHREQLEKLLQVNESAARSVSAASMAPNLRTGRGRKQIRFVMETSPATTEKQRFDIAIIGVSGRYPKARNLDEFWMNLREGRDCITEIPRDRWDHALYVDTDKEKAGKTYCKWGGFIDGVDQFDPLFFHISPREAEATDPQERLFLECAYETLEDSGYTRRTLTQHLPAE